MGIVNVTPDSFSDGGRFLARDAAIAHARRLASEGAAILDIGGESTRPGAAAASLQEELDRVIPVIQALHGDGLVLSVDTQKPEVMTEAIRAGVAMVNDVNALRAPGAMESVASSNVAVCLMHMQGTPRTMQADPKYENVTLEVGTFLGERALACVKAGIAANRIVIDPGFGFGKAVSHNLTLVKELSTLVKLGHPILAGLSRKSTIGAITGRDMGQRLAGSLAAHLIAAQNGARILRVHDVAETVDTLKVLQAMT
ncbi:MAG: dihydropteroate synthase [Betaproteobacteria bacterium]|nr:dihydropteroate synthase [Betaproteobacteria bacterium]